MLSKSRSKEIKDTIISQVCDSTKQIDCDAIGKLNNLKKEKDVISAKLNEIQKAIDWSEEYIKNSCGHQKLKVSGHRGGCYAYGPLKGTSKYVHYITPNYPCPTCGLKGRTQAP